jgi:hypothetical protein
MPTQLKAALQREANTQGRKLTQEINIRLRDSLKPLSPGITTNILSVTGPKSLPSSYSAQPTATAHPINDNGPANALTDIDRAMLAVFHTLPPEQQLALLSLFR